MPRSMWRGAISFGMVAIPIRMYLATESKSVSFRMLCPSCHHPIRNKRWCPVENKEVGWNETLRGYEVGKEEYVVVDDSDLDRLPLPTARTIEILEFVSDSDIEAGVYLKSAYYLEPEDVGVKPYVLLRRALEQTGRVAIGKIALRDREHLCRLALHDRGLMLNTLHWPDEIRDSGELTLPEERVEVQQRELDMAVMLVENLSARFDPGRYRDEYRDALTAVVEAKLAERPLEAAAPAEAPRVMDLMAALKASVDAARAGRRADAPGGDEEEPAAEVVASPRSRRAAGEASGRRRKAS